MHFVEDVFIYRRDISLFLEQNLLCVGIHNSDEEDEILLRIQYKVLFHNGVRGPACPIKSHNKYSIHTNTPSNLINS